MHLARTGREIVRQPAKNRMHYNITKRKRERERESSFFVPKMTVPFMVRIGMEIPNRLKEKLAKLSLKILKDPCKITWKDSENNHSSRSLQNSASFQSSNSVVEIFQEHQKSTLAQTFESSFLSLTFTYSAELYYFPSENHIATGVSPCHSLFKCRK